MKQASSARLQVVISQAGMANVFDYDPLMMEIDLRKLAVRSGGGSLGVRLILDEIATDGFGRDQTQLVK